MTFQRLTYAAAAFAVLALPACGDAEFERLGIGKQGVAGTESNDVSPQAVGAVSASLGVLDQYTITSSTTGMVDPLQICQSMHGSNNCYMRSEWQSWLEDSQGSPAGTDAASHRWMMTGFAKCAMASGFTIYSKNKTYQFPGQAGLYTSWKDNRLDGSDKHERVSACILAFLNGNDNHINLCLMGPGGSPFSDPCTDYLTYNSLEAGFFGDLFASTPTAYVAGPTSASPNIGRICSATLGTYCCNESDPASVCNHNKIVLVGDYSGHCAGDDTSGTYTYCNSFSSTREPGRAYTNIFTTFVHQQ
jgi:hypothetical protein